MTWLVVALISGSVVDAPDGGPNAAVTSPGVLLEGTLRWPTPPPDNKSMNLVPTALTPFHAVMHCSPVVGCVPGESTKMRGTTAACSSESTTYVSEKVVKSGIRLLRVIEYSSIASTRCTWTASAITVFGSGLVGKKGNKTWFSGVEVILSETPRIPASEDSPTTPSRKLANERMGLRVSNRVWWNHEGGFDLSIFTNSSRNCCKSTKMVSSFGK